MSPRRSSTLPLPAASGRLCRISRENATPALLSRRTARSSFRGCVESAASTSIVRLTYSRATGEATARSLSTSELRPLMMDPLLRSTRALEGLFHRAVVIGESDSDRAFYDEINRRLTQTGRGIPETQFVNAQNWSTEARVIAPLRRLGVPAAGILDLDTLWNSKNEWRPVYRAVGLADDDPVRVRLEAEQARLARDMNERTRCKERGIEGLASSKRADMRALIRELALYGLFIVPRGELESWLSALDVSRTPKRTWVVRMLRRLGSDPNTATYVKPASGDVWRFLDSIERWVGDPNRLGMA